MASPAKPTSSAVTLFSPPATSSTTAAASAAANASRASQRWPRVTGTGVPGASPGLPGGPPPGAAARSDLFTMVVLLLACGLERCRNVPQGQVRLDVAVGGLASGQGDV